MNAVATLCISIAALVISAVTAWLTLLRRGTVRMTKPTVMFFGPDGGPHNGAPAKPKVFLRSLVYSTGKRGHIIESMFVTLRRGETRQTFNIWVYDQNGLARGSGVYVGDTGVVCNHHFLLPTDGTRFEFLAGDYQVDVYAALGGAFSIPSLAFGTTKGQRAGRHAAERPRMRNLLRLGTRCPAVSRPCREEGVQKSIDVPLLAQR